jgi:two-component system chemotaxis sensor kinase CheA
VTPDINLTPDELKVFLQEVDEQLQLLDEDIIRLEKEADNVDLLQEIFRAAHTLKGSSSMVGLNNMAELTHAMEDLLDRLRKKTLTVSPELVDALLQSLDALKVLKEDLEAGNEESIEIAPLVAALRGVAEPGDGGTSAKGPGASLEAAIAEDPAAQQRLEAASADGLDLYLVRAALSEDSDWAAVRFFQAVNEASGLGEVLCSVPSLEEIQQEKVGSDLQLLLATPESAETVRAAIDAVDDIRVADIAPWREQAKEGITTGEAAADAAGNENDADAKVIDLASKLQEKDSQAPEEPASRKLGDVAQTVRVDVERLDTLMNMVGELVVDRTRVKQISRALQARYREDELAHSLAETTAHIAKVVGELNESVMQMRMLPIGLLFNKFPRLVRDLARSTGKSVDFVMEGEDTEIDRSVIEKIKDPLVHLLRNAVDHGIESPEARKAAGKAVPAMIKLSAHHEQGQIVITLEDDGKGIDAQAIKEAAVKKGAITAETAERLSDAEALDLIFESGVSTAEKTTEVSGRGVGMDVVRKSVGVLNGHIELESRVGAGTTFTLRLPLTLAIFRGLLVSSRGIVSAIPLNYVQETIKLEPRLIRTILGGEVINLRGAVMPLIRLGAVCRADPTGADSEEDEYAVVVRVGDRPVALGVDALLEQQEVVVKSLGPYMGQPKGIAGASILGDGRVVLILDVASLTRAAVQGSLGMAETEKAGPGEPEVQEELRAA